MSSATRTSPGSVAAASARLAFQAGTRRSRRRGRDRPGREHSGIGDQEEAYVGQENLVKFAEGVLWGRVMGAFGACYAMRARLFTPVPPHHIVDDFYLTLSCLEQGMDAIVDPEAVCHEAVSTDIREEFRRKRRIAPRGTSRTCNASGTISFP